MYVGSNVNMSVSIHSSRTLINYVFASLKSWFMRQEFGNCRQITKCLQLHNDTDLYIPTIGLPILLQGNMWTDSGNIQYISLTEHECGNWD